MKKLFIILIVFLCLPSWAVEENQIQQTAQPPITSPQNINFENCTKIFNVNNEKLFYLTLASISANRFNIDEIQTTNGYAIFTVNRRKYLATVAKIDNNNSILKITPCDNIYYFPYGILSNTFKYIDLNLKASI